MKFGNLLHIKDAAFLLHSARSFIQTGLNKGEIAGKNLISTLVENGDVQSQYEARKDKKRSKRSKTLLRFRKSLIRRVMEETLFSWGSFMNSWRSKPINIANHVDKSGHLN